MNNSIDWKFLLTDTRSRVYLLWLILVTTGFVLTQFFQRKEINAVWFVISVIGLGYMYRVMPLRVVQMRRIYLAWLVPIVIGMIVSALVFRVSDLSYLIAYLGAFWLVVLGAGYFWNGLVDAPAGWYYFAAALNLTAGVLCFSFDLFTLNQYLIAAVVSAWSMANLWLFRSGA